MAKWVGELSTESSRVRIGVEARRFIDYSLNQQCEREREKEKEEALEISGEEREKSD